MKAAVAAILATMLAIATAHAAEPQAAGIDAEPQAAGIDAEPQAAGIDAEPQAA